MSELTLHIFTCTLEGSLLAFTFDPSTGAFAPSFTAKDHVGRTRALLACSDGLAVTGGDDETLKLYHYNKRRAIASIFGTCGATLKVQATDKFILSAHENGTVYFCGKSDFAIYHALRVFKSACVDLDVHSSGRLMLCLSKSGRFGLWNLMTLSLIFHSKLKVDLIAARFLNDEIILLQGKDFVLAFSLKSLEIVQEVKLEELLDGINDLQVANYEGKTFVLMGTEKGLLYVFNEEAFSEATGRSDAEVAYIKFRCYAGRIKRLCLRGRFLTTVSTEGELTIWDLEEILNEPKFEGRVFIESFSSLFDYSIQSRFILLDVAVIDRSKTKGLRESVKLDLKALPRAIKDARRGAKGNMLRIRKIGKYRKLAKLLKLNRHS